MKRLFDPKGLLNPGKKLRRRGGAGQALGAALQDLLTASNITATPTAPASTDSRLRSPV